MRILDKDLVVPSIDFQGWGSAAKGRQDTFYIYQIATPSAGFLLISHPSAACCQRDRSNYFQFRF